MTTNSGSMVELYRRRAADFGRQRDELARRADRISHGRVATFLAAGVCFLAGWLGDSSGAVWFAVGGVLSAAFFFLVWLYGRVLSESDERGQLSEINLQAVARVLRKWDQIPLNARGTPTDDEALAGDLDLFGKASLFHLVSFANTPGGIESLCDWLLYPAEPAVVELRQQAVTELAPLLDERQELHRRGLKLSAGKTNPGRFFQWAEGEPWLARRPWLKWASRCLPVLVLVLVVLGATEMTPPWAWLAPVAVNVVLSFVFCSHAHATFSTISTRHGEIRDFADLFELIGLAPARSVELTRLQRQTTGHGVSVCRRIRLLGRIMDLANLRFSLAHSLVQPLLLWDFHVLALLEHWQRRNGRHVREWFDCLGQWESLASLSSLVHDNPTWTFPAIEEQPDTERSVTARSLGHPLIPDDRCVVNDVTVGPPGTFLLVTGSNMSGKSTLLRAIGTNVVLAQAGAPVCAAQFSMPPALLATSMRIHDSLAEGVSYYLAELKRLKQIVDASRGRQPHSDRILLYLLDEILQGTNTAERQIAVRRVLVHLITEGAIGAVSTHDLELATARPLRETCHAVHFRETIRRESGQHRMTFDYKLHDGVATTTNALKLLEMVGLSDVDSE